MKLFSRILILVGILSFIFFLTSLKVVSALDPTDNTTGKDCEYDDRECNNGELCSGYNPVSEYNTCVMPHSIQDGNICGMDTGCLVGSVCSGSTPDGIPTCVKVNSLLDGLACTEDNACISNSCSGYTAGSMHGTCVKLGSLKDSSLCYEDSGCLIGSSCAGRDPTNDNRICVKDQSVSTGEPCYGNVACIVDDVCYGYTGTGYGFNCVVPHSVPSGGGCISTVACLSGYSCVQNKCTKTDSPKDPGTVISSPSPVTGGNTVTNPGAGWCTAGSASNGSTTSSTLPATCVQDSSGNIQGVKRDTSGDPYCISVTGNKPNFYKCNDAVTSPGAGNGSPGAGSGSPSQGSDACSAAGKGNIDTSIGGALNKGYIGPTCGKELFDATKALTAKPGRIYADRYQCTKTGGSDNTNYVDVEDKSVTVCDHYPWIDDGSTVATCKDSTGKVLDCSTRGVGWACTFDYNSTNTQSSTSLTSCTPPGTRYCSTSSSFVTPQQGCSGLTSGIGANCSVDQSCADYAAGAKCLPLGTTGQKVCQWPNGVSPTPTPGASVSCAVGTMQVGCRCDSPGGVGGCSSNLDCKPSFETSDGTSTKSFCVPFPAYQYWCENTKSLKATDTECTTAKPYVSPTQPPTESPRCPSDGNHVCADAQTNQCVTGYSPTNDSTADSACTSWNNGRASVCMVKTPGATICSNGKAPAPTVTTAPSPSSAPSPVTTVAPKPTGIGCPLDNGDGRTNSCQSSCTGSYPNEKVDPLNSCSNAYGSARSHCCTSN